MGVLARGEYTVSPLADGATGRGVSSVVSQYAVSTSKTTAPSYASFSTNRPTWEPGKYVWTRSLITYTSGSPATSTTTPVVSSEWEAVNEIKVGGRNLLRNTSNPQNASNLVGGYGSLYADVDKGNVFERALTTTGEGYIFSSRTPIVEQSAEYTFSCDIWANDYVVGMDVFWLSDTPTDIKSGGAYVNVTSKGSFTPAYRNKWYRYVWTFTTPPNDYTGFLRIDNNGSNSAPNSAILRVTNLKLERGNKPTDWTPAPEDVDAKIDEVGQDVSGANAAIDQIISANATKQAELDAQINNLNLALSSLSAGVGENNTSTQGAIDAIQAMIATLEAQRSALSDKIASLEQAKIKTDNYIQIGTVKLSNGTTVFGVAVGKDVNVLNPDGTISTFERSMTATTANSFLILTGGAVVGVFDATGMTSESVKVNKIVMGNRFEWSMTASNAMVLKKGG